MIRSHFRAETMFSVLFGIALFSIMLLSFHHWYSQKTNQSQQNYFRQQALQIADNQIARQFVGLHCESQITQNQQTFTVNCSENSIIITNGKMRIKITK